MIVLVAAAIAFALVSAATVLGPSIPVSLYANMTGTPYHDNVPRIPAVPLLAGLVLGLVSALPAPARIRDGVRGLSLGIAAALYLGLMRAVQLTFHDPYFTAPYRIYAIGFLALATVLVAFFAWRTLRAPSAAVARPQLLGWTLLSVVGAASIFAIAERDLVAAAAALAAGAVGIVAAERRVRVPAFGERQAFLALVAVTFAFRLIFGLQALLRTGPGAAFAAASDDGPQYFDHANSIYRNLGSIGTVLAANDGFPPAYPVFLATTMFLSGGSLALALILQAVLAAAGAVLLYLNARRVAGAAASLVAVALYGTEQNMIQIQSTLTPESLLIPTALLALWALMRYRDTGSWRWMALAATCMAFAFVTRNNIGVALIVAAIFWLLFVARPRVRLARDVVMITAAFVLFVTPIALATARIDGSPRITNQLAGVPYAIDGSGDGITIENGFLIARGIDPFKDPAGSIRRFVADPLPVIGFLAGAAPQRLSTLLFFIPSGVSDPRNIVSPAQFPNPYGQVLELILVVGLLLALARLLARGIWRRPDVALLLAFTILYVSMFLFVFPPRHAFRYRIPVEPILFIAQGVGVVGIVAAAARAWTARGAERRVPELAAVRDGQ